MSFISPPPVAQSYLDVMLEPLRPFLDREDITDIYINRPCEVMVATSARTCERYRIPALDERTLWQLARQLAYRAGKGICRSHPIVTTEIPGRARVQIIAAPVAVDGMVIAIRKQVCKNPNLDRLLATPLPHASGSIASSTFPEYAHVDGLVAGQLREMVSKRRNIIIAGGTGTGKTTLLNALIREVDQQERLAIVEETRELTANHANCVYLRPIAQSQPAKLAGDDNFINSIIRLRPDRIIMDEIDVMNAVNFLRVLNSGKSRVMATIQSNTPHLIHAQISLIIRNSLNIGKHDIKQFLRESLGCLIFLKTDGDIEIFTASTIANIFR